MKSAGEIFKNTRDSLEISLEQAIEDTKIPGNYLRAIEKNKFNDLPQGVYPQIYIKKYARYLDLSPERLSALFRRDYIKNDSQGVSQISSPSKIWQILNQYFGYAVFGLVFIVYLGYQYWNYVHPPKVSLRLEQTASGRVIQGKTDPQVSLNINGQPISLDSKGSFSYRLNGDDQIKVVVVSPAGKQRVVTKQVDEI